MFYSRRFPRRVLVRGHVSGVPIGRTPPEVVFHHQPKTAGSSFRALLASYFWKREVCPAEIDSELHRLSTAERRMYRFYAGHFQFNTIEDLFPEAIWITFVRNPVERVVSNFYNLRDDTRHPDSWKRRAEERPEVRRFLDKVANMELGDFVESAEPRARDRVCNRQVRYLVRRGERVKRFPDWDEELLNEAKRNLCDRFSMVGVQERYVESIRVLCSTFGVERPHDLVPFDTNINVAEKRAGRYQLDPEVEARLEARNQMDTELWNYANGLLTERLKAQSFL